MNEPPRPNQSHADPDVEPGRASVEGPSAESIAREAFGEMVGLERRLPRTITLALSRPGFLTLERRQGRSDRYMSPVRLYLLASAIYFATGLAVASEGVNLGLVTVRYMFALELPTLAPHLVLVAAVPVFAALLDGLFHRRESTFGEYLTFALYFQSTLLVFLVLVGILRIPDPADDLIKLAYFPTYVFLAARRLWPGNPILDAVRALASFVLYGLAVFLATAAVALAQTWIS